MRQTLDGIGLNAVPQELQVANLGKFFFVLCFALFIQDFIQDRAIIAQYKIRVGKISGIAKNL